MTGYTVCAEIRKHRAPLTRSVCVSLSHRHRAQLQLEAETPSKRYPSVCCTVSVTQLCCVCSKHPSPLPSSTSLSSTSPPIHVTDNTPGSDTDHLLNDRSISLSFSMNLPLFMLPSNQRTRACKQKPNSLHG